MNALAPRICRWTLRPLAAASLLLAGPALAQSPGLSPEALARELGKKDGKDAKPAKLSPAAAKAAANAEKAAGAVRTAQLLLEAKEHKLAAAQAQEALKVDAKNVEARRILAVALVRDGKAKESLAVLDSLAKDLPGDGWVLQTRAAIQLETGDKAGALQTLEALLSKPGAPVLAYYFAAKLLDEQRKAGNAAVTAKQRKYVAAFLDDKASWGSEQQGDAERMALEIDHGPIGGNYWQAKQAYNQAFAEGGEVSARAIQRAEQLLQQVIRAKGDFEPAHALLGMCYASVKSRNYNLDNAIAELKRAPKIADAWFAMGRIYRESDKVDDAAKAFEQALKLEPRFVEAGYQLGVALKLQKKRDEAVRVFEGVIRVSPDSAAAARSLAELQVLAPQSQFVVAASQRIDSPGEDKVFNTERYRSSVVALEKTWMGGIEEGVDVVWLEKIMRRIIAANGLSERVPFRVKVGKTMMLNCFAAPHGDIYVTRGFLAHLKKTWPSVALDENNSYMAGVMAHEMVHVIRNHVVNRDSFRKAIQQTGADLSPEMFRLTTRMSEIEADREGLLYMLAAGYNPNAMVEWMERAAADIGDPPPAEDHPTFDERVSFLLDFWTNEVRFAWQAFETGTDALEQAGKLEQKDLNAARRAYDVAIVELDRYTRYFRQSKEAWNNLAIAQAKIGVLEQADKSPLARWYTPLSVEKAVAQQLPKVERKKRGDKTDVVFLERARDSLQKALELDPKYNRGLINLAAVQTGLREFDEAQKTLAKAQEAGADKVLVATLSGILAAEQGKWDVAVMAFQQAAKDSGDHPRALYCLALALQGKGDKEGAKKAYTAFIERETKTSPWAAMAQASLSGLAATP